jgi:hypothetical protein
MNADSWVGKSNNTSTDRLESGAFTTVLTCALGSLDVGELGATGFDRGPVEAASLMIGDVAS